MYFCCHHIISPPLSIPSCQREPSFYKKGGFHFKKSILLSDLQAFGVWFPQDPPFPQWKAFWFVNLEKRYKFYYIFICQMQLQRGEFIGSRLRIHQWIKTNCYLWPGGAVQRGSGSATLYWGGKSETAPLLRQALFFLSSLAVRTGTVLLAPTTSCVKIWLRQNESGMITVSTSEI